MKTILTIFVLIFSTSCATIIKGSYSKVYFSSSEGDASVYINGAYVGNTPFYTRLKSNRNYQIVMSKDSVNKKTVYINREFKAWYLVGDILFLQTVVLAPFIILDIATGSWFELDRKYISY